MSISNCMWKNKYFYFLFHNYVDDFDVIWGVRWMNYAQFTI